MASDQASAERRLAVIGAGMAGASDRMSTRRTDQWQADHGAQYFTAKSPAYESELQVNRVSVATGLWQQVLIRACVTSQ